MIPASFACGGIKKDISRRVVPTSRARPTAGSDRGKRELTLFVRHRVAPVPIRLLSLRECEMAVPLGQLRFLRESLVLVQIR